MNDLREACIQFHLPVEPELLCQLMDYCDSDRDGKINYLDFANFLNWKDKMPSGLGKYGPRRDKTCLRAFRESEFQTSLLRYRD